MLLAFDLPDPPAALLERVIVGLPSSSSATSPADNEANDRQCPYAQPGGVLAGDGLQVDRGVIVGDVRIKESGRGFGVPLNVMRPEFGAQFFESGKQATIGCEIDYEFDRQRIVHVDPHLRRDVVDGKQELQRPWNRQYLGIAGPKPSTSCPSNCRRPSSVYGSALIRLSKPPGVSVAVISVTSLKISLPGPSTTGAENVNRTVFLSTKLRAVCVPGHRQPAKPSGLMKKRPAGTSRSAFLDCRSRSGGAIDP